MSNLIVTPVQTPGADGGVLSITPQSAGWEYVGFEVFKLAPGQALHRETENKKPASCC